MQARKCYGFQISCSVAPWQFKIREAVTRTAPRKVSPHAVLRDQLPGAGVLDKFLSRRIHSCRRGMWLRYGSKFKPLTSHDLPWPEAFPTLGESGCGTRCFVGLGFASRRRVLARTRGSRVMLLEIWDTVRYGLMVIDGPKVHQAMPSPRCCKPSQERNSWRIMANQNIIENS